MKMCSRKSILVLILFVFGITNIVVEAQQTTTLVPAIITFGDSAVDVGNNDYINTFFKANYPPYGRDFANQMATGRFCNGKLATDITADTLGFTTYPPPYLSPQASGRNLLIGANFASAGSGYDERTAALSRAIPLSQQLQNFREYQAKLANLVGVSNASSILNGALYIVSFGSSDYVQNYYVNPLVNRVYTTDQYSSYLTSIFQSLTKNLYGFGARRIGVTSLPPLGCLPATRTLFGGQESGCVSRINTDAQVFNNKIKSAANDLQNQLSGLRIAVFDTFTPIYDLVRSPSAHGFVEARRGCCGTGTVETTVMLCNTRSPGTCANASQYVFWDSVHPSQTANQILADSLVTQGISLIS